MIVDDWEIIRQGIKSIVSATRGGDFTVCLDIPGCSIQKIEEIIKETTPDVLIIDPFQGRESARNIIKSISSKFGELKILIYSTVSEPCFANIIFQSGGKGYISKRSSNSEIVKAIHTVIAGGSFLCVKNHDQIMKYGFNKKGLNSLGPRELEIFELIGKGYANIEIGKIFKTNKKTVSTQVSKIKEKLNLRTRVDLVHTAIEWLFFKPGLTLEQ